MSNDAQFSSGLGGDGMFVRKLPEPHAEFDITAMIDLVFMMNIYFIVAFITIAQSAIETPVAQHCEALDSETALFVTVLKEPYGDSVNIFVGDDKDEQNALPKGEQEMKMLLAAVDEAMAEGKTAVLLRAEKEVVVGELYRISSAIAPKGVELRMGVKEKEADE